MKKILILFLVLTFTTVTTFAQSNVGSQPKDNNGSVSSSSQGNFKVCPMLKHVLAQTKIVNNKITSIPDEFSQNNSLIRLRKNKNNEVAVRVFIKSNNISATSEMILSKGGEIGTIAGDIFTAELPVSALNEISLRDEVVYIDASYQTSPLINVSRSEIKADIVQAGGGGLPRAYKGSGVIVGSVDTGIDWSSLDFKNAGGSRILYLWDMSGSGTPPSGYSYGREYTKAQIDASQCIEADLNGHGTHTSGIAVGNGTNLNGYIGMAPLADIIFVKGERTEGSGFQDADVIDACNYIFQKAQSLNKSAVINLSIGGEYGPHDGTSLYEQGLSNLTGAGKIIVAAAGNSGAALIHVSYPTGGTSYATGYQTLWQISSGQSSSLVDLWYNTGSISVGVAAYTTGGAYIGNTVAVAPGGSMVNQLFTVSGTTYGRINIDATNSNDANNHDKEVIVQIDNGSGAYNLSNVNWVLYTYGSGTFDAWVVNGGNFTTQSTANFRSADNNKSVGAPGTSSKVVCVGAYTTKYQWQSINGNTYNLNPVPTIGPIASFSSIGPSRDGRIKPDLVAPGQIIASDLSSATKYQWQSINGNTYNLNPVPTIGPIASFSSIGPSRDGRIKPDLVAPGQMIASDLSSAITIGVGVDSVWVLPGGKFQMMQGTSMACPHVTGTVALLLERNRALDYTSVFNYLTANTTKDTYTGNTPGNVYGYGKLNALSSMLGTPVDVNDAKYVPNQFALEQNYPNPFNPSTAISYQLSAVSKTTLKVFNILGQEVATLVNEVQQAGVHIINFNANNLSSGIYFYQLKAGSNIETKKMILMK